MKFHEYLESTYVSTNLDLQKEYTVYGQAKTQAVQSLINGQRKLLKWASYTALLVGYLLVVFKLKNAPLLAMDVAKAAQAEALAAHEAQTQKQIAQNHSELKVVNEEKHQEQVEFANEAAERAAKARGESI